MRTDYRGLRTERLLLRRPCEGDAASVFASFGADPEVTRFLAWRPHRTLADAEAALVGRLRRLASGDEYSWMLTLPEQSQSVIGIVSAWCKSDGTELGFVLARPYWNLGYMTEAVCCVADWALSLPDAVRVWATCDVENGASARVLEKACFTSLGPYETPIVRPNISPLPRTSLLFARPTA